jgi:predicted dehydrogenase
MQVKLGLCVIGCGGFAKIFAEAMKSLSGELDLYFASRDTARAQAYASEFGGAGWFGSYADAAADSRVEALYICTPHHLHLEHAKIAADADEHLLIEKPIAPTVPEGLEIVSAAERAGVTLMVAGNYRFLPAVQKSKELIDSGALGDVRLIQLKEQFPFNHVAWRNDPELNGGGVLIDGGIHKASVLAYLAGRPNQAYAAAVPSGQSGLAAEDGILVVTKYADGVVGVINYIWSVSKHSERPRVSVVGTAGSIYFELGLPWLKLMGDTWKRTLQLEDEHRGLAPMLREFSRGIRDDRSPAMTGAEAIKDLNMVRKAYESMELGTPVPLDTPAE